MTLTTEQKREMATKFGKNADDVGSVEVQIALLTQRIGSLEDHFKTHKKDNHSRRGLITMVSKRRKLLKYLMRRDYDSYQNVTQELGLRR